MKCYDLVVIGGGSGGISAAIAAYDNRVKDILVLEKEDYLAEIVAKQMLRKIKVDDAGDTNLIAGSVIDINEFKKANRKLEKGKKKAGFL